MRWDELCASSKTLPGQNLRSADQNGPGWRVNPRSCLNQPSDSLFLREFVQPLGDKCLGHSGISVTMNTYAHVLPVLRQEAADAIDELFGAS